MADGFRNNTGRTRTRLRVELRFKDCDNDQTTMRNRVLERMLADRMATLGHGRDEIPLSNVTWTVDGLVHMAVVPMTLVPEQTSYLATMRVAFAHMSNPLVDITVVADVVVLDA